MISQDEAQGAPSAGAALVTPDWVADSVFYQIFPDRFARSERVAKLDNLEPWDSPPTVHGYKGGDLIGVVEQLDYLQDLGVNAIYFCPVFKSTANHRYHTYDYFQVDPMLGGNEALRLLVDELHRRGMRIVLDGVFNHCSRGFYQFSHLLENGLNSPYLDWYRVRSWPLQPYGPGDPGYECWWNLRELPKFNTSSAAVREFLWSVGEHWLREGIDGWRLDVPNEIDDDDFWREFRRRVKAINGDAYIVGEIWGDARRWLRGDQFDAVMNYLFTRVCLAYFGGQGRGLDAELIGNTGLAPIEPIDTKTFAATIEQLLTLYPWSATVAQLNLLDSHDTPRFLSVTCDDESALRLATLFQMTFPGAPCVYYGDEIGLIGGPDPDCRRTFDWNTETWNHPLRRWVRECIALRHRLPVLRRGSFRMEAAEDGLCTYRRDLGDSIAWVVFNIGQEPVKATIVLDPNVDPAQLNVELGDAHLTFADGRAYWDMGPRSGTVIAGQRRAPQ